MRSISSRRQSVAAAAMSFDWYSWVIPGAATDTRHSTNNARSMDHPPEMPGPGYHPTVSESPRLEALAETVAVCVTAFIQQQTGGVMKIGFVGLGIMGHPMALNLI